MLKNGSRRFAESQRDIPPRHIAHCDLLSDRYSTEAELSHRGMIYIAAGM